MLAVGVAGTGPQLASISVFSLSVVTTMGGRGWRRPTLHLMYGIVPAYRPLTHSTRPF